MGSAVRGNELVPSLGLSPHFPLSFSTILSPSMELGGLCLNVLTTAGRAFRVIEDH